MLTANTSCSSVRQRKKPLSIAIALYTHKKKSYRQKATMKIISFLLAFAVVAHAQGPVPQDAKNFKAAVKNRFQSLYKVTMDNHEFTKEVQKEVSRLRNRVKAQHARILNLELKDPKEFYKRRINTARLARALQDGEESTEAALP